MPLRLDHVVIAVDDLDAAIRDYEALGFTVVRGGVHANRATYNALITFADGTYLELLAATGESAIPGIIDFGVLLHGGEGFSGFALRSSDLEADAARLRAAGLALGTLIPGERRRDDGTEIRWKLALVQDGFAPFLIQDITPREWRIPGDPSVTTHANRALGLRGVEIVGRDLPEASEFYTTLVGMPPKDSGSNYAEIGDITLRRLTPRDSRYTLDGDDWPYLKLFGRDVPQAEIDAADPAAEPAGFDEKRRLFAETRAAVQARATREQALLAALEHLPAALSAVQIVREAGADEGWTPDRTHGVYFQQHTGTPPTRGDELLVGLDAVDWEAGDRLARDIPHWLRELTSSDAAVRENALHLLREAIRDQSGLYDEAFDVAPFLLRLLAAPDIQDKSALIGLLEGTVCGSATPEQQIRIQALMREALPVYLALLDHPDREVRWMAVRQLYLYETEVKVLEPLLRTCVTSDPDDSVRGECVGALAGLWTGAPERWMFAAGDRSPRRLSDAQMAYLARLMRDAAQPPAVQYRAARTLVRDDPGAWLESVLAALDVMMQGEAAEIETMWPAHYGNVFTDMIYVLPGHLDRVLEWIVVQAHHPGVSVRRMVPSALIALARAGQPVERMIPEVIILLGDPSPDVRERAAGFCASKPYFSMVNSLANSPFSDLTTAVLAAILGDVARHDPSLTVRTVARRALRSLAPDDPAQP